MEGLKTVLFYTLGLAALIVASIVLTRPPQVEISQLPPATLDPGLPIATPQTPQQTGCQLTPTSLAIGYLPGAPLTTTLVPANLPGERLMVSGTVYAADEVTPVPNALVEVWQADAEGRYDYPTPLTLRARMYIDSEGRYQFITIKPGHYQVGCQFQPAHIHYRVTYLDNQPFFALMFFENDPYLAEAQFVEPTSIRPLTRQPGTDGVVLQGTFDIVLPRE